MTQVEKFLEAITAAENTKLAYRRTLNVFGRWAGKSLPSSADEAQEFLHYRRDQGLKPATISLDAAAMLRYLSWKGVDVRRLEHPSVTLQAPEYLSRDEIRDLMAELDSPLLECVVALCYDSAARIREILGVAMKGVDLTGFLRVTRKGGRQDTATVSEWGLKYLRAWLAVRERGHPMLFMDFDYGHIYHRLKEAAGAAALEKFHPHMLRHSRAIHLHEGGMSWEDVGYVLGHVNVSVTMRVYGRPNPQDLRRRTPAVDL